MRGIDRETTIRVVEGLFAAGFIREGESRTEVYSFLQGLFLYPLAPIGYEGDWDEE